MEKCVTVPVSQLDDLTYDIDDRITYSKGGPGQPAGELKVDFTYQKERVVKRIRWRYPETEAAAIRKMMEFLSLFPNRR